MTTLFTESLSFLHSRLGCLLFSVLNQHLQKQCYVGKEDERLILDMQKSQKKPHLKWEAEYLPLEETIFNIFSCAPASTGVSHTELYLH